MQPEEIGKVQAFLRKKFDNNRFAIKVPLKPDRPVEVYLGEEFIGTVDRDEDEGEVSYTLSVSILDIDLEEF